MVGRGQHRVVQWHLWPVVGSVGPYQRWDVVLFGDRGVLGIGVGCEG